MSFIPSYFTEVELPWTSLRFEPWEAAWGAWGWVPQDSPPTPLHPHPPPLTQAFPQCLHPFHPHLRPLLIWVSRAPLPSPLPQLCHTPVLPVCGVLGASLHHPCPLHPLSSAPTPLPPLWVFHRCLMLPISTRGHPWASTPGEGVLCCACSGCECECVVCSVLPFSCIG